MNPPYPAVAGRAQRRCEYCRAPEIAFNLRFEVEHIVPVSQSGSNDLKNLALACRACNLFKSNADIGFDEVTQTSVRLFHPRQDLWNEHFAFNAQTGEIMGGTPIGRATVSRLQLNSPESLEARLIWMRLGLFP